MSDWLVTSLEIILRGVSFMFGRVLRGWLQKGLDNMDVTVKSMSFAHIQTAAPFIDMEIEFKNMSLFVIQIDRQVNAIAKLLSQIDKSEAIALLPVLSELDLLRLLPNKRGNDILRVFITPTVVSKIMAHANVGQVEQWRFTFKWRVVVNGQVFACQRTIVHEEVPRMLVLP